MVIHLHNKHIEPLEQALRVTLFNTGGPEEQLEAARAALAAIEQEKQHAPYRLWLKSQPQPVKE